MSEFGRLLDPHDIVVGSLVLFLPLHSFSALLPPYLDVSDSSGNRFPPNVHVALAKKHLTMVCARRTACR